MSVYNLNILLALHTDACAMTYCGLRSAHALDVDIHRRANAAMAHDGLNCFVIDAERVKVGGEAAAEGVPAVPPRESFVPLE